MHCLELMVKEKLEFTVAMIGKRPEKLKLSMKAFEEKVVHHGLGAVAEFLKSREFEEKYTVNGREKVIEVK